jgi:hypothetical protein
MLPEVYGGTSDAMLQRLLTRKGISEQDRESKLASVEQRGSAYLPRVNAFYIREFQMMHAAEEATRFLHHACRGLPDRLNGSSTSEAVANDRNRVLDRLYVRVVEDAAAFFGSRVLYPSRPAPDYANGAQLSRAALEKAMAAAVGDNERESCAQQWGYRIGQQIYEGYLAGKVAPSAVRRLFLTHLDEPGAARKVCATVIAKLRSISRPLARSAHA